MTNKATTTLKKDQFNSGVASAKDSRDATNRPRVTTQGNNIGDSQLIRKGEVHYHRGTQVYGKIPQKSMGV